MILALFYNNSSYRERRFNSGVNNSTDAVILPQPYQNVASPNKSSGKEDDSSDDEFDDDETQYEREDKEEKQASGKKFLSLKISIMMYLVNNSRLQFTGPRGT